MTTNRTSVEIARGVLLGTFVGDALGARWEGAPAVGLGGARWRLEQSLTRAELTYTDDTQLTLALAEHLCEHPHVDQSSLVETFLDHFEGHRGYARGMFGLVEAWQSGMPPAQAATAVFPDGSFGNGAAMRVGPVGVVWHGDPETADAAARRQAAVTHAHPVGMDGAAVQAQAVATAARAGDFTVDDLQAAADRAATEALRRALTTAAAAARRWASGSRDPLPEIAEELGTGVLADQSVPVALWIAAVAADLSEAVLLSLALGGDVDTIAAMACAVTGAAYLEGGIPPAWLERLEDGPRGRSYTLDLAARLAAAADASQPRGG